MTRATGIGRGVGGGARRKWIEKTISTICISPFLIDLSKDLGYSTPGWALYHLLHKEHQKNIKEYSIHPREYYDKFFEDQDALDREIAQGKEVSRENQFNALNRYLVKAGFHVVSEFKDACNRNDLERMARYQKEIARVTGVEVSLEVMRERATWKSPTGPGVVMKGASQ